MTNGSSDRLDRIEALLEQMAQSTHASIQASNERLTRMEQMLESNNRFLEAFGEKVDRFADTADKIGQQLNSTIATSNQDRQEANSRLSGIQRKVDAIARHLGVESA